MPGKEKKLTNMVWRTVGEAILLSLSLFGITIYLLYFYGFLRPIADLEEGIWAGFVLVGAVAAVGAVAGYIHSSKIKKRLEQLREAMIWLEKGNLSRAIPPLGDDEVGRLGEQLGRISKKWEDQVTTLQRLSTNNAELAEKVRTTAVLEERQRLARDLHDAVSQQLFAISMTATAVGRTLDKDFARARRQIALIEEMAAVAQSEMRALLLHLRPVNLQGKSLSAGLHELLEELQAKVPIEIAGEIEENIFLPKGIEDHLFRIAQEALSNTLRHSRATKMEVRLHKKDDSVRLSVRDNGIGFDPNVQKQASYGLTTMQERVNEVGGSLSIVTAPGKGTRVDIRIPIMKSEGDEKSDRGKSD
ncbi:MAG TPA: sensor histidine kinase [Bacilli bacterium]